MSKLPLFSPIYGIRPAKGKAQEVVAPPYDVLNSKEAREMARGKPWSFLHVSKAEIDFPDGVDVYSDAVYRKAGDNFKKMIDAGMLVREKKPCFYVYRLQMGAHIQTGLVVGACIEDYDANRIRKHEFTRPVKEEDRAKQIKFVQAQTGPGLIAYKQIPEVAAVIKKKTGEKPEFSVEGIGGVIHTLWVLGNEDDIRVIADAFERQAAVYIADGHHRSAAASRVRKFMIEQRGAAHTGAEPYNYYLAVAYPINEMKIWDYNRVVKDLNGLSPEAFMAIIKGSFEVKEAGGRAKPAARREFGMYLGGKWYLLKPAAPAPVKTDDPVLSLDVSVLSDLVLDKILGIKDLRKSDRIDFVGGIRGLEELEKRVDSGEMQAAFALFPPSLDELIAVADDNQVMPPKSTWFEPKLADGMVSNPLL
ncbi:MAG: hypothetical protein A2X34_07925 [Elusimicrobia bacterium GWC2_51_8]|nr:MAG: hypothetical protein A2X33_06700 [Elusimicrobia bacterium GWA2_51_34]OGR60221.1 MAG: hypothetical protein A2X34_07925 [Elusimicrobia bacterium GWC2_51_8]HAF96674.1 DUF1015 domain-containing protein [Elusimicrobiota bacterium]HCE96875.1 DUF1015 domain-containing protein [Elusimicrobiota bacterium]